MLPISARWIQEFEKYLYRRQHLILYSNIHDRFLWQGNYHGLNDFLDSYFLNVGFEAIVRYDPIDGFTFPQEEMRQLFEELAQKSSPQHQEHLGNSTTPTSAFDPLQPPARGNPGLIMQRQTSTYLSPEVAFSHLRTATS